jgi:hypothetical protein
MIEDMQLRGLSARTQECYVTAVRQLAAHHHRSPDQLSEEDLRQYFLYLTNEKKVARATATIALCGIKFLFEHTLLCVRNLSCAPNSNDPLTHRSAQPFPSHRQAAIPSGERFAAIHHRSLKFQIPVPLSGFSSTTDFVAARPRQESLIC